MDPTKEIELEDVATRLGEFLVSNFYGVEVRILSTALLSHLCRVASEGVSKEDFVEWMLIAINHCPYWDNAPRVDRRRKDN